MVSGTFAIGAIGWITNTSSSGEAQRSHSSGLTSLTTTFCPMHSPQPARPHISSANRRTDRPRSGLAIDQCRMAGAPAFPLEERRSTPLRASGPEPEAPLFPPISTPSQSPKRKNRRPLWVYRFCENASGLRWQAGKPCGTLPSFESSMRSGRPACRRAWQSSRSSTEHETNASMTP